jgi:hypothetical protein
MFGRWVTIAVMAVAASAMNATNPKTKKADPRLRPGAERSETFSV